MNSLNDINQKISRGNFNADSLFNDIKNKLKELDEVILFTNVVELSEYRTERGIFVNPDLSVTKKFLLTIHEFAHFLNGQSESFSPLKEEIVDNEVKGIVINIIKALKLKKEQQQTNLEKIILKEIEATEKDFLFKKFFN